MTSDKLLINDTCEQAGAVDKASEASSPLSANSSAADGAKHVIPASEHPRCSAKPFPAGSSAAANITESLFIEMGEEADNILQVEGATVMDAGPVTNLRDDCRAWLNDFAQCELPLANAKRPQLVKPDLILRYGKERFSDFLA